MSYQLKLIDLLTTKEAVIGIVGLGYIGLPIMQRFAQVGYRTVGFDTNINKINALAKKYKNSTSHGDLTSNQHLLCFTDNIAELQQADAIIICVPTPLNKNREPDLTFVINAMDSLLPYLHKGQIISLESTTYPGTTEEELKPRIESKGFSVGEDIFLLYSPERIDPGNQQHEFATIPKICGGITPACSEVGEHLYKNAVTTVHKVSSTKAAEMTKLLENIHRAVNIGLANEMKIVADKMGVDIYEVIKAAATKPFGFVPYYPGPGLGGHCIPIDPFYLTWKAREYGIHTKFIELAGEINNRMPEWVVNKIIEAINMRDKTIKGSQILILGLSYKKDIDDVRESPAIEIMTQLLKKQATVNYSDPFVPQYCLHENNLTLSHTPITKEQLEKFDCVVLVTNHSQFDFELIRDHAKLLIDTRGVYHNSPADHIVNA